MKNWLKLNVIIFAFSIFLASHAVAAEPIIPLPKPKVEKEIVEVGELDPDQIHVSGVYVDRIVLIPEDGIFY